MVDNICWISFVPAPFPLNYFGRMFPCFERQIFEEKCVRASSHPADACLPWHKRPQIIHVDSVYHLSPHCFPSSSETRVLNICQVLFCYLFQSIVWFLENSLFSTALMFSSWLHIFPSFYVFLLNMLFFLYSLHVFNTHMCVFALRFLFVPKMEFILLTVVFPAL